MAQKLPHFWSNPFHKAFWTSVRRTGAKRAHTPDLPIHGDLHDELVPYDVHKWCSPPDHPTSRQDTWTCPVCGNLFRAFSVWDTDYLGDPSYEQIRKRTLPDALGWTTRTL